MTPIRASAFRSPIYGRGYRQLLSHAYAYVHATRSATPTLVEAMGYGNCVVVHDTPENREVAGPERPTSGPTIRPRSPPGWRSC
ncbi:MAG: hypothetical protein R2862_09520 [Thermoanaerobaculia bacterium]